MVTIFSFFDSVSRLNIMLAEQLFEIYSAAQRIERESISMKD